MPAPGDQHRATANPFEEVKPHIGEYTAQEIATLQSRLEKQLGPEYISTRPGAAGQKVHYVAAEKCINLANEVFGFNGWSSGIQQIQVDFCDESQSTGKINLGLSVIVRVTLRDGTFHEDIGYGHIENCKSKAAAFEKAKKEGTTDGLKRALRNFGNILGNCIYDKEYVAKVTKLKIAPSKWDADNLHRHSDYAPIKKESVADADDSRISPSDSSSTVRTADDEFGGDEFDEADFSVSHGEHPDEVILDASVRSNHSASKDIPIKNGQNPAIRKTGDMNAQPSRPSMAKPQSLPAAPTSAPQTPTSTRAHNGMPSNKGNTTATGRRVPHAPQHQGVPPTNRPPANSLQPPQIQNHAAPGGPRLPNQSPNRQRQAPIGGLPTHGSTPPTDLSGPSLHEPTVGFFTARAAETLQNASAVPPNVPQFNPHLESPSIRKTAGIDHTKTKPVGRETIGAPPIAIPAGPPARSNFVNPQADQARRIGMPGAMASPLQNRNSYKPPQIMKRPADGSAAQFSRPALNDVTSASVNTPLDIGGDSKRQKLGTGPGIGPGMGTGNNNPSALTE